MSDASEQGDNRRANGQFRPGASGNPGGRPNGHSIVAVLRQRLEQAEPDGRTLADVLADALVAEARTGNLKAIREVLDRTEGRPRQSVAFEDSQAESSAVARFVANLRVIRGKADPVR